MARESFRIVIKNIGSLLRLVAALPLLLIPIAVIHEEWLALAGLVATSATMFVFGYALAALPTTREPRLREGMLIAAVGWLLVPLGSMIHFMIAEDWGALNAYFECMSAWTGTGMTVADVTALTHTTLAWRSLMQWVGGLGVIVLTLIILARPGTGSFSLYASEGREDKLRPSVISTVRTLWVVYLFYTVMAFLAFLLLAGLDPWHSFNNALTGIATGGMSLNPGSIGDYASARVEAVAIVVMITGAIPFVAHYAILRGHWRPFVQDEQVKTGVIVMAVAIPVLAYFLAYVTADDAGAARAAIFQIVSAVTTTGWQTADIGAWPQRAKLTVVGLMILGGAAGSTAGGLKLVRGSLLVKGAFWKLERAGLPYFAVTRFRWGGRSLDQNEANEEFAEAAFISVLGVVMLFFGILVMMTTLPASVPIDNLIFEIASVQGNSGLSTGLVGPALPVDAKVAIIGVMWAGRLEILPVLLLVREVVFRFKPNPRKR